MWKCFENATPQRRILSPSPISLLEKKSKNFRKWKKQQLAHVVYSPHVSLCLVFPIFLVFYVVFYSIVFTTL